MMLKPIKSVISLFLLLVVCEIASAVDLDSPEKFEKEYRIDDSISIVLTYIGDRSFIYVFQGDKRLWKSPQMHEYFCMEKDSLLFDLDDNGTQDFLLSYGQCKFMCNFGVFISLNKGEQNYIVHYSPSGGNYSTSRSEQNPLLEISSPILPELWSRLEEYLARWSCDSIDKNNIKKMITGERYSTIKAGGNALPELRELYRKAMRHYRGNKLRKAKETIKIFFDRYDYRSIDPSGNDKEYTMILNDYGFFLQETKASYNEAYNILSYVIKRDPTRAVAYLNLGDLQYQYKNEREKAKQNYRIYYDLMLKNGEEKEIPKRVLEKIKSDKKGK